MTKPIWDDKEESLDDLILGGFKIIQPRQGYRFSLDAVLLAHFPELHDINTAIDLGSGNGVIPLLLAYRKPTLNITGIEIQEEMVKRAQRSIIYNRVQERITIKCLDIRAIPASLPAAQAGLITCNPPFWREGEGKLSGHREAAIARHEIAVKLIDILTAAAYLLKPGGRLALIHRAARLEEIKQACAACGFTMTRIRMVRSFPAEQAKLVLIEGVLGGAGFVTDEPPLVVYQSPGCYSREIRAIYTGALTGDIKPRKWRS